MSVNVEYPSEYYKEAITAKGRITSKIDLTANPENNKTPLDVLVENDNTVELKALIAAHPKEVYELVKNSNILAFCSSATTFKMLHDCYHVNHGDYEYSHFEDALGALSGATLTAYVHRVKSDDETENALKDNLTLVGLRNFVKSITWTPKSTLVKNDKNVLTAAGESIVYITDFIEKYYGKDAFFKVDKSTGLTILHELVETDKNFGKFLYIIKVFDIKNLESCVDANGNTVLNYAIQNGSKKIVEYLLDAKYSINDSYNEDDMNSACSIAKNYAAFGARAKHYVSMIDESKLKDAKLSFLNHISGVNGIDVHDATLMPEKMWNNSTGSKKGKNYKILIAENEEAVRNAKALAEAKAKTALLKAQAAANAFANK